jgi:hypothetical protein
VSGEPRERQPWDKRPGESYKAHKAFRIYLDLGERRSLVQVAHDYGATPTMIRRWSADWDWVARTDAWDIHISAIKQAEREKVAREVSERWARRKLEAAESNWSRAQEIAAWADDARHRAPLFEEEVTEQRAIEQVNPKTGEVSQILVPISLTVKPLKWTMATILEAYKTVAALQAAAITEATQGVVQDDGFSPETATPDQLRAWLAKQGVKALPTS